MKVSVNEPGFNEQEAREKAGYRERDAMDNAPEIITVTDHNGDHPEHKILWFKFPDGTGAEWNLIQKEWVG